MFCPKCRDEIGEFAKFCPECGQSLENDAKNITDLEDDRMYVLTIKRPIQLHAVNLDIAIMVDGEIECFIPNGGEVAIPLTAGIHSIGFIYSMVNKCVNVNVCDNVSLKVQFNDTNATGIKVKLCQDGREITKPVNQPVLTISPYSTSVILGAILTYIPFALGLLFLLAGLSSGRRSHGPMFTKFLLLFITSIAGLIFSSNGYRSCDGENKNGKRLGFISIWFSIIAMALSAAVFTV